MVAHSFGGLVAIELAKLLERNGLSGEVIITDGAVSLFKKLLKILMPNMDPSHENVGMFLQAQLAYEILPELQPDAIQQIILEEKTFDARMNKYISLMKKRDYSDDYLKNIGYGLINRVGMILRENDVYTGFKIKSNITLIRPTTNLVVDIENDYQLKVSKTINNSFLFNVFRNRSHVFLFLFLLSNTQTVKCLSTSLKAPT